MNLLKGLILSGALFLSSCTPSYKQNAFPKDLTSYLASCSCTTEHAACYLQRTGNIVDISKNSGHNFVTGSQKIIDSLVQEDSVIFGHTHSLKVDDYLLEAKLPEDEALYVKRSSGLEMEKRMFSQFPSPGIEGATGSDFEALLSFEKTWFISNPDASLRYIIVLLSDYEKPKVIEYGLTDRIKKKYHKAILNCDDACKNLNPLVADRASVNKCEKAIRRQVELEHLVLDTYADLWISYYTKAFNPSSVGDYKENSLDDFINSVNRSGIIYMHDLGYLNTK